MDNICAIATPYGVGAISIIRTSGPDAIKLVNEVFKGKDLTKVDGHTLNYGYIMDKDIIVDEILASVFIAPNSFSGENSVELNCHGGIFTTNKVLEVLLKNGFRLANPGEFSTRAYLNKKMDLTQAEAVMDIISSNNMNALKSANLSLRKSTKKLIDSLRADILNIIAQIEVNIDYPEYDDAVVMTNEILIPATKEVITKIEIIEKNSEISKVAIHGISCAIIGKPNVGKSSILNMLLDEDKAIVSPFAGTTRDIVEGDITIGGITLHLIDTAGIRDSDNYVEQIGIEKSKKAINNAELILLVFDNSKYLDKDDLELLELTKNKKRIIIVNKIDLNKELDLSFKYIPFSTINKTGIELFIDELINITKVNEFVVEDQNYLSNTRHLANLSKAKTSLLNALNASLYNMDVDLIEIDLKQAFNILGEITGEAYQDELIDALFSKFCLGK